MYLLTVCCERSLMQLPARRKALEKRGEAAPGTLDASEAEPRAAAAAAEDDSGSDDGDQSNENDGKSGDGAAYNKDAWRALGQYVCLAVCNSRFRL